MKKFYQFVVCFLFGFLFYSLYQLTFESHAYYEDIYEEKTNIYVKSLSTPRGRILDIHGNILVDNVGVKAIVYRKVNAIKKEEEIEIAYLLSEILSMDSSASLLELKKFWLAQNEEEAKSLITKEEYDLYEKRKLTSNDLYLLKLDRITEETLSVFSDFDKKAAYLYSLMNKGYYYDAKLIKLEVTEEEYARILEKKIKGVTNEMYFKREYPYGNTLRSLFGSVGTIPKELETFYKEQGYALDDMVGISYLEQQYDSYLQGEKSIYKVQENGVLEKVFEGKRGNDLVLSLDIGMQLQLENIVKEEIIKGKSLKNTEYYQGSYVLVGDTSGKIKSIIGLKYLGNGVFKNVESDVIHSSFTVGSVVKGAGMAMAYQNGLVDVGKKIKDSCVKLYLVPQKCSYKSLGYIDDIAALKTSSNYYQFLLAIKLAGQKYSYNMKLNVSEREFSIYRNAFASFGLGVTTGIDLPKENTGIRGTTIAADLLLNFAIGQYDTYTPVQLLQYINTIANNGNRYSLSLLDHIVNPEGEVIYTKEQELLSSFSLDSAYFERIKTGLYQVVNMGTGSGYVDKSIGALGKTGTSESYYDSNMDGKNDVLTITNTFAMYAPMENPKYSMVVVSPNVSHSHGKSNYFAYINRYISKAVSDFLFLNS